MNQNIILPKQHFQQQIDADKMYLQKLTNYHNALIKKIDCIKAHKIHTDYYKVKNVDEDLELSKHELESYEITTKIFVTTKALEEKIRHNKEVFLPFYENEIKECEKNWNKIHFEIVKIKDHPMVKKAMEDFGTSPENIEIRNNVQTT